MQEIITACIHSSHEMTLHHADPSEVVTLHCIVCSNAPIEPDIQSSLLHVQFAVKNIGLHSPCVLFLCLFDTFLCCSQIPLDALIGLFQQGAPLCHFLLHCLRCALQSSCHAHHLIGEIILHP